MIPELDDYDWAEVFGEGSGGNTNKEFEAHGVAETPFSRDDVTRILVMVNGENDGDGWVGLFLLADGRYLAAQGWCDYTGWDCRAGNQLTVAGSLSEAAALGMDDSSRRRIAAELAPPDFPFDFNQTADGIRIAADWWDDHDNPENAAVLRAVAI